MLQEPYRSTRRQAIHRAVPIDIPTTIEPLLGQILASLVWMFVTTSFPLLIVAGELAD